MNKQRQQRRIWSNEVQQKLFNILLKGIVQELMIEGKPKWNEIAKRFNESMVKSVKRNPKQCRERWLNTLSSESKLQNNTWSTQSEILLIQACKKYGNRWSKLSKEFGYPVNENKLKNNFNSTIRKLVRVINSLLKSAQKQYKHILSSSLIQQYSQPQQNYMIEINKLREFKPKFISKVFSLMDSRQQYKYQTKQNLQNQNIKQINFQILQYMQDYVSCKNAFSKKRILDLILGVMMINRTFKIRHVRESKMALLAEQIMKQQIPKKKKDRKGNGMVGEEGDGKCNGTKKNNQEMVNRSVEDNKMRKKSTNISITLQKKGESAQKKKKKVSTKYHEIKMSQKSSQDEIASIKTKPKWKDSIYQTERSVGVTIKSMLGQPSQELHIHIKQEDQHEQQIKKNRQNPQHYCQNIQVINSSQEDYHELEFQRQNKKNIINFVGEITLDKGYRNIGRGLFGERRLQNIEIKMSQDLLLKEDLNTNFKMNQSHPQKFYERKEDNEKQQKKQFQSDYLNNIPVIQVKKNKKQNDYNIQQIYQQFNQFNPFGSQNKLTVCQVNICSCHEVVEVLQNIQNNTIRSNSSSSADLIFGLHNSNSQASQLKNSRGGEGVFSSLSYESSGSGSWQSQKRKSSVFNSSIYPPIPTNAPFLAPNNNNNTKENEPKRIRDLLVGKIPQVQLRDYFAQQYGNMFESTPIELAMRKLNEKGGEVNGVSGGSLYRSYQFGV